MAHHQTSNDMTFNAQAGGFVASCQTCSWRGVYGNKHSARRAAHAHFIFAGQKRTVVA